jgi:hypothetical protein
MGITMSEVTDDEQASRSEKSAIATRTSLLIPASAAVALAFGGAGCDGESRRELYERVCEKLEECEPELFTPGAGDDFYASVEECADAYLEYVSGLARDYTSTAACYEALVDLYDCFYRAIADVDGCGYDYYDYYIDDYYNIYEICDDAFDEYGENCYDEEYPYY